MTSPLYSSPWDGLPTCTCFKSTHELFPLIKSHLIQSLHSCFWEGSFVGMSLSQGRHDIDTIQEPPLDYDEDDWMPQLFLWNHASSKLRRKIRTDAHHKRSASCLWVIMQLNVYVVIVSSPWIGSSVSLHSWWSLSRSFHTFVMMRGVSRSLPPTRRIPQGVCWPSRSNVTATSLILCILHWDSHSTAGALNGLQLLVLIIFYSHPLLS